MLCYITKTEIFRTDQCNSSLTGHIHFHDKVVDHHIQNIMQISQKVHKLFI